MVGDGREQLFLILPFKGRLSTHHLIEENTIGPPVHTVSIGLVVNNLWGDVVWCPAKCLGGVPIHYALLAQPKVCNFDVALLVKHDVVQLEVPVDDPMAVEVENTNSYLCRIEPEQQFYNSCLQLNCFRKAT